MYIRLIQEKEWALLPSKNRRNKVLLKPLTSPNWIQLMLQLRNQKRTGKSLPLLVNKNQSTWLLAKINAFPYNTWRDSERFASFLLSLFMFVVPQFKRASRPPGGLVKVGLLVSFPSQGFQCGQSQTGLKNLHSQQISSRTLRLLSPAGGGWGQHVKEPCWRSHPADSWDDIFF